jgi:hypothetical protein
MIIDVFRQKIGCMILRFAASPNHIDKRRYVKPVIERMKSDFRLLGASRKDRMQGVSEYHTPPRGMLQHAMILPHRTCFLPHPIIHSHPLSGNI